MVAAASPCIGMKRLQREGWSQECADQWHTGQWAATDKANVHHSEEKAHTELVVYQLCPKESHRQREGTGVSAVTSGDSRDGGATDRTGAEVLRSYPEDPFLTFICIKLKTYRPVEQNKDHRHGEYNFCKSDESI